MDHFRDSICERILNADKDLEKIKARVNHLRLEMAQQSQRIDLKRLDPSKGQIYAWLQKKDEIHRPLATKMITFTKEELRRLMPPSRALECEGGDDECVDQINDKVQADGGTYKGE